MGERKGENAKEISTVLARTPWCITLREAGKEEEEFLVEGGKVECSQ